MAGKKGFAGRIIDDSIAAGKDAAAGAPDARMAAQHEAARLRRKERAKVKVQTAMRTR